MDPDPRVLQAASELTITPRGARWAHVSLCVLDAVFSMGARYTTTVRTCRTYAKHAGIVALQEPGTPDVIGTEAEQSVGRFVAAVDEVGAEAFATTVLHNRQRTSPRHGILKAKAAHEYAEALVDAGVQRYGDLPALLADDGRVAALEKRLRGVRGNGNADVRLGYLWMLLGDEYRIKPDRMVLRWLGRVLEREVDAGEAREVLAGTAAELGCTPWELDHAVWNDERGRRSPIASDTVVRRRHRAQQGRWRDEVLGVPAPEPVGPDVPVADSMLPESHGGTTAREAGWNLMSDAAVGYARTRIPQVQAAHGVVEEKRLWHNLLSSQPLAFSIAGELRAHPVAALPVLSKLTGREIVAFDHINADDVPYNLDGVQAEWAPRPETHTDDRSAADIAAAVRTADGRRMLITIEVKYTDDFSPAPLKETGYRQVLSRLGLGDAEVARLRAAKATQFLRSVLLTESVRANGECDDVLAVVLGRADDEHARTVVDAVARAVPSVPARWWSITDLLDAAARQPELAAWSESMAGRYVGEDG